MYKILFISSIVIFSGCSKQLSVVYDEYRNPKPQPYAKNEPCNFTKTLQSIKNKNHVELLKHTEQGLINFYQGNYEQAARNMQSAINLYKRKYENSKLYDATPISVAKLFTNIYLGEKYDKVFLHNYAALSYLFMGKVERAKIESRLAARFQNRARVSFETYKKRYHNYKNAKTISIYEKAFSEINPNHHPYANPFADYIFALACAENNLYSNARSSIANARRHMPNSAILNTKYQQYSQGQNISSVELFFDVGQSPLKSERREAMKMGNGDQRMAYLPSFDFFRNNISYIKILDKQNREVARTSLLVDIDAIKINEFREKLPSMLSLIGTQFTKEIAYFASERQSSGWVEVLIKGLVATVGRPSQATWVTLPKKTLVASFIPKKEETYTMVAFSSSNKELDRKALNISKSSRTKNIYRYFTLKNENFCKAQ